MNQPKVSVPFGVANNFNRVNSQGRPPISVLGKSSVRIINAIPAGGSLPLSVSGKNFYVLAASGPIHIKPSNGSFNEYRQGTGLAIPDDENAFTLLEIRNDAAVAVAFEIFVGWDEFIDKRLILDMRSTPFVTYPTYDTATSAPLVDITDLSGTAFTDINGNEWYAIYRVALIVCNPDTGVTLLLQEAATVIAGGPAIAAIYPLTSLRLETSGNYRLHLGGANINAIVSEIYAAIPKTS